MKVVLNVVLYVKKVFIVIIDEKITIFSRMLINFSKAKNC